MDVKLIFLCKMKNHAINLLRFSFYSCSSSTFFIFSLHITHTLMLTFSFTAQKAFNSKVLQTIWLFASIFLFFSYACIWSNRKIMWKFQFQIHSLQILLILSRTFPSQYFPFPFPYNKLFVHFIFRLCILCKRI